MHFLEMLPQKADRNTKEVPQFGGLMEISLEEEGMIWMTMK